MKRFAISAVILLLTSHAARAAGDGRAQRTGDRFEWRRATGRHGHGDPDRYRIHSERRDRWIRTTTRGLSPLRLDISKGQHRDE